MKATVEKIRKYWRCVDIKIILVLKVAPKLDQGEREVREDLKDLFSMCTNSKETHSGNNVRAEIPKHVAKMKLVCLSLTRFGSLSLLKNLNSASQQLT